MLYNFRVAESVALQVCSCPVIAKINEKQQILMLIIQFTRVNGKIARLKQQISELEFLVVLHVDIVRRRHRF